jgi:hypothetical protein
MMSTLQKSLRARNYLLTLAAVAVIALLSGGLARDAQAAHQVAQEQQTISDLRAVGVAMFHWYKEVQAPRRTMHPKEGHAKTVDLAEIPEISHDELAKLLVPKYIAAVPEKDAWGHPYEFRLNTKEPDAARVMAVRSAGADGAFSGTTYTIGSFPPAQTDQDLVWVDGYFTRWPAE